MPTHSVDCVSWRFEKMIKGDGGASKSERRSEKYQMGSRDELSYFTTYEYPILLRVDSLHQFCLQVAEMELNGQEAAAPK